MSRTSSSPDRHVVVGAGPVGLCAAIDLTLRGVPAVVLDDSDRIGEGSRAINSLRRGLLVLADRGMHTLLSSR